MTRPMTRTFYVAQWSIGVDLFESDIPDIATAMEGFWVNDEWEYTNKSDNVCWIPPSAIRFVKKELRSVL